MRKLAVSFWVVGLAFVALAVDLPTMGWSSWNTYRVNISEELIKRQADALVDGGFAAVGYKYVNIDDGWFGGRDKDGRHTTNPKRFPNGLKPVVDYIHAKGLEGPYAVRVRPGERAVLGFEILGPVKNPVVAGHKLPVTLESELDRVSSYDGRTWQAIRITPGKCGPDNRTAPAKREVLAEGAFDESLPVLSSGTTELTLETDDLETCNARFP